MTTKDKIEIMQAAVDGKPIEYRGRTGAWMDNLAPTWNWDLCEYRIKHEPRLIPIGPEDVPPGSVLCGSGEVGSPGWVLITSASRTGVRTWRHCSPDNQTEVTWAELVATGSLLKRPGEDWTTFQKLA